MSWGWGGRRQAQRPAWRRRWVHRERASAEVRTGVMCSATGVRKGVWKERERASPRSPGVRGRGGRTLERQRTVGLPEGGICQYLALDRAWHSRRKVYSLIAFSLRRSPDPVSTNQEPYGQKVIDMMPFLFHFRRNECSIPLSLK